MRRIESCHDYCDCRWCGLLAPCLFTLWLCQLCGCQTQPQLRGIGFESPESAYATNKEFAVSDEPASKQSKSEQPTEKSPITAVPPSPAPLVPDPSGSLNSRLEKNSLPPPATASATSWVSEAWVLAPADPNAETEPREHWRHVSLEAMLELPRSEQPAWSKYLAEKDAATRAQAAIALAKLGDMQSLEPLLAAVREPKLKLSTRRAAAEALGRIPPAAAQASIEKLLQEFGRFDGAAAARYLPELHAEMLLVWQRHATDGAAELAVAALASPSPAVRRAALKSFLQPAREELPVALLDLAGDRDALVRGLLLRVLAARRDARVYELAEQALLDPELSVKIAALRALAEIGGEAAVAILHSKQHDPGEMIRAAALAGLVKCGEPGACETALDDKSFRVRCALAETLIRDSSERGQKLAARLLADKSAEVRRAVLSALSKWPWPAAGPLLLTAAENEFASVRQEAIHQLRSRWSPARELTASASLERLQTQCAALRWELNEELRRLQAAAGPVKLAAWEEHITDEFEASAEKLVQKTRGLLKQQDQAWRNCAIRLREKQPAERRAALQDFHQALAGCACEPAIWKELQTILEQENDTAVWLAALAMFAAQHEPELAPLLALGTSHQSAEVRKQAIEWFITHPNPAYGDLLTNSLLDDHVAVIQAALRALAALDELPNPRAIEELLAARDPAIRLAAAYALAAHGIPPGYAALIRLAYHEEPQIRRQVAILLGELGDIRSINELIRLLDDRPEVQLAGLAALELLLGRDISQDPGIQARAGISSGVKPGQGKLSLTCAEQCRCWKTWHSQHQARAGRRLTD